MNLQEYLKTITNKERCDLCSNKPCYDFDFRKKQPDDCRAFTYDENDDLFKVLIWQYNEYEYKKDKQHEFKFYYDVRNLISVSKQIRFNLVAKIIFFENIEKESYNDYIKDWKPPTQKTIDFLLIKSKIKSAEETLTNLQDKQNKMYGDILFNQKEKEKEKEIKEEEA